MNSDKIEVQATISEDDKNSLMLGMGRHLIQATTPEERELENALQKVKNIQDMGAILIRYAKEKEKKGEKLSTETVGRIFDKIVDQKIKVSNENADILNSPKRKEYEKFKKDFNAYLKLKERAREANENKDLKRELELLEQAMQNKDKHGGNGTHPGCNQYEHKPGCPHDKD